MQVPTAWCMLFQAVIKCPCVLPFVLPCVSITCVYREMQVCRDSFVSMSWMKHQRLSSPLSPAPLGQITIDIFFSLGEENWFTLWKSAVQSNVVLRQERSFVCLLLSVFYVLCWGLESAPVNPEGPWLLFHQVLSGIPPIWPPSFESWLWSLN